MIRILLTKETEIKLTCPICWGTGKVETKQYHNRYVELTCPECSGKGKITVKKREEIELKEALKLIENTP